MLYTFLIALQQQMPHQDMPHHTDGGVWWTHWLWFVFLALVIAGIIALVMSGRRGRGESAREALDRRYAKGEISTEEYEERKTRL